MATNGSTSSPLRWAVRLGLSVALPLGLIAGSLAVPKLMMSTAPKAERIARPKTARLVDIVVTETSNRPIVVEAMGTTVPAIQVDLKSQVTGRIDAIDPALVPGGRFKAGAPVLQVEKTDYELAVAQRKSEVLEAEAKVTTAESALITARKDLQVEEGNQQIAQREFALLGEAIPEDDRDLVLRVPQLMAAEAAVVSANASIASAKAAVESAKLRVHDAQLDLGRAAVKAPFNAIVMARYVDLGDVVSTNTTLTALVGTDRAWVEAAVPVSQLRWLKVPAEPGDVGSAARIYNPDSWGADAVRVGNIIGLAPELDTQGRMARVLIAVDDPFALAPTHAGLPRMLIGSYVRVELDGPVLEDVVEVSRSVVRDGNTVWVMTDDDTLDVRPVEIIHSGREHVLVSSGLTAGDRIITTDLATAITGLSLQLRGRDSSEVVARDGGEGGRP